jgi:phage-related protein
VPRTKVVFYREADGTAPVLKWFDGLPARAQDECRVRIQRLAEEGHALRRSEADLLRDGIYELRIGLQRVNYRILYFFHGRAAAVLAHGLTKKDTVPDTAIETALARKRKFEQGPALYTFEES